MYPSVTPRRSTLSSAPQGFPTVRVSRILLSTVLRFGLSRLVVYIGRLLTATDMPLVGIMDTEEHLQRRKPWARAFNGAAIREYEPLVAKRTHQLVRALEDQKGEVDIGHWVNYFR